MTPIKPVGHAVGTNSRPGLDDANPAGDLTPSGTNEVDVNTTIDLSEDPNKTARQLAQTASAATIARQGLPPDVLIQPQSTTTSENELVVKVLKEQAEKIDYKGIVGNSRVIFFGEDHNNYLIREHIAQYAKSLRAAGITHYAIETTRTKEKIELLQRLAKDEEVDLSAVNLGPLCINLCVQEANNYELAVRAMANEGITVVPIDIDPKCEPSQEDREEYIAKNILDIVTNSSDAKVAVLIGRDHTSRKEISGFSYTAKRIIDSGVPCTVATFAGGTEKTELSELAKKAALADSEFALDMRRYTKPGKVPFEVEQTDYVIHLPQKMPTI